MGCAAESTSAWSHHQNDTVAAQGDGQKCEVQTEVCLDGFRKSRSIQALGTYLQPGGMVNRDRYVSAPVESGLEGGYVRVRKQVLIFVRGKAKMRTAVTEPEKARERSMRL